MNKTMSIDTIDGNRLNIDQMIELLTRLKKRSYKYLTIEVNNCGIGGMVIDSISLKDNFLCIEVSE